MSHQNCYKQDERFKNNLKGSHDKPHASKNYNSSFDVVDFIISN